jgi:hypothetical protein
MLNEVSEFFTHLDEIDCWVDTTGVEHFPFQTAPSEFLEFAENDLKQKGPQATGNALANAKRALDCQLDYFLLTYGLTDVSNKQAWSTSKKISLMDDLGIVPQSILHRVNKARNDFEHRYEMPSLITAENSIDIVGLFVAATDLYLFPARYGTYFEIKDRSEPPPEEKLKSKGLLSILRDPLAFLHLELLHGDAISAAGKLHGLSFDYQISSVSNLNEYLYLLTHILHSHRINTPNANKFFQKLKYGRSVSQNGG